MLIAYTKVVEIDVTYHQCLMIKIGNLIKNELTNLDGVSVNRYPSSDIELANKTYVDELLGSGNILRFNQTKDLIKTI